MRLLLIMMFLYFMTLVFSEKCGYSRYHHPLQRAFVRKRRFIVFPNYCAMKITVAVGKHLVAKQPTGTNLSLELSVYYALPTKLEEWFPKRYRKKNKMTSNAAMPPKVLMPMKSGMDYSSVYYEGGSFHVPNSDWNNSTYSLNKLYIAPQNKANRVWINKDYSKLYRKTPFSFNPTYTDTIKWGPYQTKAWKPSPIPKSSLSMPRKNLLGHFKLKHEIHKSKKSRAKFKDELLSGKNETSKKYDRGHRDRRDLYNYIEKIGTKYGYDLKSCILRAICESKRYLLPIGYSLIQDIIRLALTLPSDGNILDEYSAAQNSIECDGSFEKRCPFSIIDMALNPNEI